MAKITVPGLKKRGLVIEVDSEANPKICFVSEQPPQRARLYLVGDERFKNGNRRGVKAEKQSDFLVVASSRIFSRYVLPSGDYRYKCEGVLFLTSLEEALVQAGFDIYNYPD